MKKRLAIISLILIVIFLLVIIFYYRNIKTNTDFIMYIEDVYTKDDEVYLTGIIDKGKVRVSNELEINGTTVKVKEILLGSKKVKEYSGSDRIGINIGNTDNDDFKRGSYLATKGLIKTTNKASMEITLNSDADIQIKDGTTLVFKIGNENYAGTISMEDSLVATQTGTVSVTFDDNVPLYKGINALVKYDGIILIGKGKVTKVD